VDVVGSYTTVTVVVLPHSTLFVLRCVAVYALRLRCCCCVDHGSVYVLFTVVVYLYLFLRYACVWFGLRCCRFARTFGTPFCLPFRSFGLRLLLLRLYVWTFTLRLLIDLRSGCSCAVPLVSRLRVVTLNLLPLLRCGSLPFPLLYVGLFYGYICCFVRCYVLVCWYYLFTFVTLLTVRCLHV